MEKQTDSVETVKSIASDLKAVEPIVSVKNLIDVYKRQKELLSFFMEFIIMEL